jgi:hypothetical protein
MHTAGQGDESAAQASFVPEDSLEDLAVMNGRRSPAGDRQGQVFGVGLRHDGAPVIKAAGPSNCRSVPGTSRMLWHEEPV